ncbi:MAG TPA: aminotransferase class I/II-fold pyridoxal phosphate-dependent enzyme [Ignavibacteria bacterium]|nr:aminotransferase class I/II-fold pyridoxal phosphate-dependent enzyme [Ignavibacteria bacterium]
MMTIKDVNPNLIQAQYAVRGKIVARAQELEEQGRKIIYCNIGNPQALKQKPVTFIRQVLSVLEYPELINNPDAKKIYPADVMARAKMIMEKNPTGTGAYTVSSGIAFIRDAVAEFITKRDGIPADKNRIVLTDGASKGVQAALTMILKGGNDGVMIPIPQYPLYSATLTLYGAKQIGYFLDESNSWQLNEKILEDSIREAKGKGINPVAIAVINPGNPTGAVLSKDNMEMIIRFAKKYNLVLLADEVYQENVYLEGIKFVSFAKAMHDMGEKEVTLFSFHSVSKGFLGECGHRGGYFEVRNMADDVYEQLVKLQSVGLCSNVDGQIVTYLMVAPPKPGDESYELYKKERDGILNELKYKSRVLGEGLNAIDGMECEVPHGAMYAFVKFELPHKKGIDISKMAVDELYAYDAKRDFDYCMALLEKTGICVVPGSGFGQMPNTMHFRTTILPPREDILSLVEQMKSFHREYAKKVVVE